MTVFVGKSTAETTQCHSGVKKPVRRADQSVSAGAGPSTPSAVITYNSGKSDKRPPWGGGEERRDSTERYSPPCRNRKLALGETERSRAGRYRTREQKAAFAFGDGSGRHLRGQNQGHGVVENALSKEQSVQVHVHLQLVEDGQDRDWTQEEQTKSLEGLQIWIIYE